MNISADELFQLVQSVWSNALAMRVAPGLGDSAIDASRSIAASIRILGKWNGAVLLECPVELARQAAAVLFGIAPEQVFAAEMEDAVVELVNRLADQLAAALPIGCRLLLPARVENSNWSGLRGEWPVGQLAFRCPGGSATIAIVEEIIPRAVAA